MYKVNLLPPKLQREGVIDIRRLVTIAGITLLIVFFLGGYGVFLSNFFSLKNDLVVTKQQLVSLAPVVSRVEKIKNERKELEESLKEYRSILKKRITWFDLLLDLNNITPVDLWLTELEIAPKPAEQKETQKKSKAGNQAYVITFKGFSRTVPSIGVFINNLYQLPHFQEVRLQKLNAENEGIKFEITAITKGAN